MMGHPTNGADASEFRKASRFNTAPALDRLPPHSIEAEQGVLGCLLLNPREAYPAFADQCLAGAEMFYDLRNQEIFKVLAEMCDSGAAVDLITIVQKLKDLQKLEGVGGVTYLAAIVDRVPSTANLSYYAEIVKEKFILRRIISVCTGIVARVYEHAGDVHELVDEVEREVMKIGSDRGSVAMKPMKELMHASINTLEEMHKRQGALFGIGSGFVDFDKMTGGFRGGQMIVIAARPSIGKSSIALNIAEHITCDQKLPVGMFSLEMTAEELAMRLLCSRARVNLRNVQEGFMSERDFPKLTGAAGKLSVAPLWIDDTSVLTILQLRARLRRMVQAYGIKVGIVDYLQLLRGGGGRRYENRNMEITDISNGIKAVAKELNIPVIVLAQLNRDMERENRKPRLSDLRESGAIEADADLVGFLYKPKDKEDEQEENSQCVPINLLIGKQRNGPTGEVHLTFLKTITRFESAAKVSDEDQPTMI